MTLAELEHAEKRMQQQWHDLVMAEQEGKPLETLEQMYDEYILLAEDYNHCMEEYQREGQEPARSTARRKGAAKQRASRNDTKNTKREKHVRLAS